MSARPDDPNRIAGAHSLAGIPFRTQEVMSIHRC